MAQPDSDNPKVDLNVLSYMYDEEFISLINGLSGLIRDYFRNNKLYINNIKLNLESINEQTLFSKSSLNDILIYLNQPVKVKLNINTNEKYIREKLYAISERMERINELKANLFNSIRSSEAVSTNFYDEAKNIFKKMKEVRSKKIEEINYGYTSEFKTKQRKSPSPNIKINKKINSQTSLASTFSNNDDLISRRNDVLVSEIGEIKSKYNELVKENEKLKLKLIQTRQLNLNSLKSKISKVSSVKSPKMNVFNSLKPKINNLTKSKSLPKNNSIDSKKKTNIVSQKKSMSTAKKENSAQKKPLHNRNASSNLTINTSFGSASNNNQLTMSTGSNDHNFQTQYNTTNASNNTSFSTSSLPSMVLSFLSHMKKLQECINNKTENIKEMKRGFEKKKKELERISESLLGTIGNYTTVNSVSNSPKNNKKIPLKSTLNNSVNNVSTSSNNSLASGKIIDDLNSQIEKLKGEVEKKDEKIKTEKSISKLCEEKLSEEKQNNKNLLDEITLLKENIKNLNLIEQSQKEKIEKMEKEKEDTLSLETEKAKEIKELAEENKKINTEIDEIKKEIKKYQRDVNEKNDLILQSQTENSTLKTEISKLKSALTECNNNIITISNTNENIIEEKDKIIKNLNQNISDLNSQIDLMKKDSSKAADDEVYKKEIEKLNAQNSTLQSQTAEMKKENKELKNKIAEIKNEYVARHDEQLESLRQKLIEINDKSAEKLNFLSEKNNHFQQVKEEYASKLSNANNSQNDLILELKESSNEYFNVINTIKAYSQEVLAVNAKLEAIINSNYSDKDKEEVVAENIKLKEENERLRGIISQKSTRSNQNRTLSNINEQNSNFIDDELSSVSGIIFEEKKEEKKPNITASITANMNPGTKQIENTMTTVINEGEMLSRKNSQSSIGNEKYQATIKMMEDNESLLKSQLDLLKMELKSAKEERDKLREKLSTGNVNVLDKEELMNMLKQTFEKLVEALQLSGKIKDYVVMILKILNYNEDEIQTIVTKKDKKNNLFTLFK